MNYEGLGRSGEYRLSLEAVREREKLYESVVPIEVHHEIPKEKYLKSLNQQDRENLARLFACFDRFTRMISGLTALAVGSTTLEEQYWAGLEKYLAENDPTKIGYAERRGEDIDIILCPDGYYEYPDSWLAESMDFAMKDLEEAKIDYIYEEEKREIGTSYLTVPKEHQQQGESVIRHKRIAYPGDSLVISFPVGRNIHISLERMLAELKIKSERVHNYSFSLLFRGAGGVGGRWDFIKLIQEINATEQSSDLNQ